MIRKILAVTGGVLIWTLLVTVTNLMLRKAWPGYAVAEAPMAFSLGMLLARLAMSAVASVSSAWMAAVWGRGRQPGILVGVVLLVAFVPVHYGLWQRFPVWYHLAFLGSLPLLAIAGSALACRPPHALSPR